MFMQRKNSIRPIETSIDHVEHRQEVVGRVVAFGPVLRLEQPAQQDQRQQRRGAQHQGADAVRLLGQQRAA